MDSEEEMDTTLEMPSEEDELVSSFQLSSDSVFCPSSVSGLSSAPTTPRSKKLQSRLSPRGKNSERGRVLARKIRTDQSSVSHRCNICNRLVTTQKGLDKHVYNHKLEERAKRRPTASWLREKCHQISVEAVEEMKNAPGADSPTHFEFLGLVDKVRSKVADPEFADFVNCAVVEPLEQVFCASTARLILPPSIKQEVRRALHTCLAEVTVRHNRCVSLHAMVECEDQSAIDNFLFEFCRSLIAPVSASIIGLMRDATNDAHQLNVREFSQDFDSLFNQQTLHRIAGYSMKAVLVKSRQYKNSERWRKFKDAVLGRLATQGIADPNSRSKNYWTSLLSKKSLLFVNDNTLQFFVEVAKVMCYTEAPDGVLSKSKVLANVTSSSSILALWGTLIGQFLDEQESMYLMRVVVLSLCGTFGKGIMLRRLNQAASENIGRVSGVALRGRLCR